MRLRLSLDSGFENLGGGMLSSSLRAFLPRTQPVALLPCRYHSLRLFSRSCRRLQAELVDNLTPTNRIRNIAIIAHGEHPKKKVGLTLNFFFNSRSWKNNTSRPTLTPIWHDKTTISY